MVPKAEISRNHGVLGMGENIGHGSTEGWVMTLAEAAAKLRISRNSAYEAARRNEIPTIRIGRRILVPADAFERLLSGKSAA